MKVNTEPPLELRMATQMVIRIRQGGGDDMDWTVLAEEVTFTDTLVNV